MMLSTRRLGEANYSPVMDVTETEAIQSMRKYDNALFSTGAAFISVERVSRDCIRFRVRLTNRVSGSESFEAVEKMLMDALLASGFLNFLSHYSTVSFEFIKCDKNVFVAADMTGILKD